MYEFWDAFKADPDVGVGRRHHVVPRFYLRRFANKKDQVWVRSRKSAESGLRNISDIAIKDMYTFTNTEGQADGRFEQLLAYVERNAAQAIRRLTSPVMGGAPASEDEHIAVSLFVAFQLVRGLRERRSIEIMGDLAFRLETLGADNLTGTYRHRETGELVDLTQVIVVPDTNEHIKLASEIALKLFDCLIDRPLIAAELSAGALLTCDEPVIIDREGLQDKQHRPTDAPSDAEFVHISSGFGGVGVSGEIALPVGRNWLLALGPRGSRRPVKTLLRLDATESLQIAREANDAILRQAYGMAFSHPDDRLLLGDELPESQPLMHLCGLPEHFIATVAEQNSRRRTMLRGRSR